MEMLNIIYQPAVEQYLSVIKAFHDDQLSIGP
jgi:hypothetical protein